MHTGMHLFCMAGLHIDLLAADKNMQYTILDYSCW
jgi:hypothetical protein